MTDVHNADPETPFGAAPEVWLAAIVDSSEDAIVGKTLDSVIRSWNAGATRIFGYAADEMIGQSLYRLIPPELHEEERAIVARLQRGERIANYDTTRIRKDGERIEVSLSVSPIRNSLGVVVGASKIARDVTEARRLERAERALNEQLQELAVELEQQIEEGQALQAELEETNERLLRALGETEEARVQAERASVAKSQFLATMSHELRTPLNAIVGYVQLLDMELRGPVTPLQRADFQRIKRSSRILLQRIDDVLSLAKLQSGTPTLRFAPTRLDEVLANLEPMVLPLIGDKPIAYVVEPLDQVSLSTIVHVDRDKVEQILLNLLSNAAKFTERGQITVSAAVNGDEIRLCVRDSGEGIRAELLETIFEPFTQGDRSLTRSIDGTGLGLAISRELAQAMGGAITVASTVGAGSLFTLVLPRRVD